MVEKRLTYLFQCILKKEWAISQDCKDASKIHLYKRKGNPQVYDNHRDISLINCWKILANILLNRLYVHRDQARYIPKSQCELRKDRGTIKMIFTARQLQEEYQEQNMEL